MVLQSSVRRVRAAVVIASLVPLVALVPSTGSAAPAPTVASVTAQLDTLARRSEVLAEKYNGARIALTTARTAARQAQARAGAAERQSSAAHENFVALLQAQYEDGPSASTGAILTSRSPQQYIDGMDTQAMLSRRAASIVDAYTAARSQAEAARVEQDSALRTATAQEKALKGQRDAVQAETDRLTSLLATLTEQQRQAYLSRHQATLKASSSSSGSSSASTGSTIKVHAGSAAAQKAVDFALAQVGKPYVYGAAGPDSYDCSGLTMASWASAGVSIPHQSTQQYNYGTHVSFDQLQPGDLVFLYSDLSHVEIYIGNGQSVSAPQPGENVRIVNESDYRSDFAGATRLA